MGGTGGGDETRRRPEGTVLHEVVRRGWPELAREVSLPARVHAEVRRYLGCGQLARGFVQVQCEDCRASRLVAFNQADQPALNKRASQHQGERHPAPGGARVWRHTGDGRFPTRSVGPKRSEAPETFRLPGLHFCEE